MIDFKKMLITTSATAVSLAAPIAIISCASSPTFSRVEANSSNISYLAFGDSVTAGYNSEVGFDVPGKMENGKIEGLSYPAFIAKYIQDIDSSRLTHFKNMGISGSTVVDWLFMLGDRSDDVVPAARANLDRFLAQEKADNNPNNFYKNRLAQEFGDFGKNSDADFNNLKNEIRNSNLITITLGANDFLKLLYSADLSKITSSKNEEEKAAAISEFKTYLASGARNIARNIIKLSNRIRKLNPNTQVVYVGYPMPLLRLVPVLDDFLGETEGQKVSNMLLSGLNTAVKNGAKLSGFNYIETYDEDDWNKNPEKLSKVFYDIHPTGKGYKKMAQDILLKISLSGNSNDPNYYHYFDRTWEDAKQYNSSWDQEYWLKDRYSYYQLLSLASNDGLVEVILGTPNNEKLFEDLPMEKDPKIVEAIAQNKQNIGLNLKDFLLGTPKITETLIGAFSGFLTSYDSDGSLMQVLNHKDAATGKSNIIKIMEGIINGKFFLKAIAGFQEDIDTLDLDKNGVSGVQKLSKNILLSTLVRQILKPGNIKLLIEDLTQVKIEGTNKSIINFATPVLVKLLQGMKIDATNKIGEFLQKEDSSGKNNFEKLFTTLTNSNTFNTILTRLETSASELLNSNKTVGFSDVLSLIMGEIKKDFSLIHSLIKELITSDFVSQNRAEVKEAIVLLVEGLAGSDFFAKMLSGAFSSSNSDAENLPTPSAKPGDLLEDPNAPENPFSNMSDVMSLLLKPAATKKLLGQLIGEIIENPNNIYSNTPTLGTMLKLVFQRNEENFYEWVKKVLLSVVKDAKVREYAIFNAIEGFGAQIGSGTPIMIQRQKLNNVSKEDMYTPMTEHERKMIINFYTFFMDHGIEYNYQMIVKNEKDPRAGSASVPQKLLYIIIDNIVDVIDGNMPASQLIDKLKQRLMYFMTYGPIYLPESAELYKKHLSARDFAKWEKMLNSNSELLDLVLAF